MNLDIVTTCVGLNLYFELNIKTYKFKEDIKTSNGVYFHTSMAPLGYIYLNISTPGKKNICRFQVHPPLGTHLVFSKVPFKTKEDMYEELKLIKFAIHEINNIKEI